MILASKSPRRKEILENLGFNIVIKTKEIDEISDKVGLDEQIKDISYKKAIEIAKENPNEYVVSADTLVEVDGEVLGKPKNEDEAKEMLKKLSGRCHQVLTGYTIINLSKGINKSELVKSKVYFKNLSETEIEWYIQSREPLDKAGAYGIQGLGSIFVDKIDGDFFSIMGFPINSFIKTLSILGIDIKNIKNI